MTLGGVAGAGDRHNVVLANAGVVDLLDHNALFVADLVDGFLLVRVDLDHLCLAVFTNNPSNTLGIVNLGDQVDQLTSDVTHTTGQVVAVVVCAHITFTLAGKDGLTGALIGTHAQRCVVLAGGCLDVFSSASFGLQQARRCHWWLRPLWQGQHSTLTVCNVRIDLQIRPVVGVGGLPLVFVAFKLTTVADKRRFGGQSQHLGFLGHPVVVHALGILGVTHQARHVQAAINFKFVADDADHGDPLACPLAFFEDLVAVDLAILDLWTLRHSAAFGFAVHSAKFFVFRGALKRRSVAGVQVQRGFVVIDVVIVGNPNSVFVEPVADGLITHAKRLKGRNRG